MKKVKLSYVLTTYNKLQYLKITLALLMKNVKEDEEIIITDGGSNDGTIEYLKELLRMKRIDTYISEKDWGEAHGFNKGMLMARGEIIKLLSDDDAYFYEGIQICKNFMLDNPQCHVVNSNGGWAQLKKNEKIEDFTKIHEDFFKQHWLVNGHPFAHCGLGLMLRKDALPLLGLFGVGFSRADAEYTLKISSLKINYTWYTGYVYVRILNKDSNSLKLDTKINIDTTRLNSYYGFDIDKIYEGEEAIVQKSISYYWRSFKIVIKKSIFKDDYKQIRGQNTPEEFSIVFDLAMKWLGDKNNGIHQFLTK